MLQCPDYKNLQSKQGLAYFFSARMLVAYLWHISTQGRVGTKARVAQPPACHISHNIVCVWIPPKFWKLDSKSWIDRLFGSTASKSYDKLQYRVKLQKNTLTQYIRLLLRLGEIRMGRIVF